MIRPLFFDSKDGDLDVDLGATNLGDSDPKSDGDRNTCVPQEGSYITQSVPTNDDCDVYANIDDLLKIVLYRGTMCCV